MSYIWDHVIPSSLLEGGEVKIERSDQFDGFTVEVASESVEHLAYNLQMLAMTFAVMAESVREGHQPQN